VRIGTQFKAIISSREPS